MDTTLASLFRSKGMRVTAQRLAVLEAVQSSPRHLCAEQVYELVRQKLPRISLATVYKALNELRDMGKVRVLPVSGKLRFDAGSGPEHHHFHCDRCDEVSDVYQGERFTIPDLPRADDGFEIREVQVDFRGICGKCLEMERLDLKKASNG